jgi:cytochrome c-type biogenesis protein CcmH
MRVKRLFFYIGLLLVSIFFAQGIAAKEATPLAKDPQLEKHLNDVTSELRCLVCQNQTIADSHADLAIDLKNQIRGMLADGKSKKEVVDYMVKRYGDFVLYRPPVKPTTYLLWSGPFLLLAIGAVVLFVSLKRRNQRLTTSNVPLSDEESKQLETLLHSKGEDKS